jgi:hypothetical protein
MNASSAPTPARDDLARLGTNAERALERLWRQPTAQLLPRASAMPARAGGGCSASPRTKLRPIAPWQWSPHQDEALVVIESALRTGTARLGSRSLTVGAPLARDILSSSANRSFGPYLERDVKRFCRWAGYSDLPVRVSELPLREG